jgi:hypothetical protein
LGVTPNGSALPDFLGWEVKQFNTRNINNVRLGAKALTLMTPQPTGGFYADRGVREFVMRYGYDDMMGREDRKNYGGIYICDEPASTTGHTLTLSGFNPANGTFDSRDGGLVLQTNENEVIASWGFDSLLTHWNRKHSKAVYVPSNRREIDDIYQYRFGHHVFLGVGTSFSRFLMAFHNCRVYYDPGIKVENISTNPKHKHRSQFRVKARDLHYLYDQWEEVDLFD